MEALDLDQIKRIRSQLTELDMLGALPLLTSIGLQYFWDLRHKRCPLPLNRADITKVIIGDSTLRRWNVLCEALPSTAA